MNYFVPCTVTHVQIYNLLWVIGVTCCFLAIFQLYQGGQFINREKRNA